MVTREQNVAHQRNKRFTLVPLTGGEVNADRDAVTLDQKVDLGAEAATRVAQRMLRRFDELPGFWPD